MTEEISHLKVKNRNLRDENENLAILSEQNNEEILQMKKDILVLQEGIADDDLPEKAEIYTICLFDLILRN